MIERIKLKKILTKLIILRIYDLPPETWDTRKIAGFLLVTFIVSALFGFLMKWTGLFPHLDMTYYKKLGPARGALHDGVSGLIVNGTIVAMILLGIFKSKYLFVILGVVSAMVLALARAAPQRL